MTFEILLLVRYFKRLLKLTPKNLCKHKILKFLKCSKNHYKY